MKQSIKKNILSFILTIVLFSSITVIASTIYSTSISVDTTNISGLDSNSTLDDAITGLYLKAATSTCPSGYNCYKTHATPQVGDYVKMTPTKTSVTVDNKYDASHYGYDINLSKADIWRVIKINNDGSIELVSENVIGSLYVNGKEGYKNLVGLLNEIASNFENSKYTKGSRHMGYNGQTECITDTSNSLDSTTLPWSATTSNNDNEKQGGGDTLYETDLNLVQNAIGTLKAFDYSGTEKIYWLASRVYIYNDDSSWQFNCRAISKDGKLSGCVLYSYARSNFTEFMHYSYAVRPIVVLKSGISYKAALGTIDDPFILE